MNEPIRPSKRRRWWMVVVAAAAACGVTAGVLLARPRLSVQAENLMRDVTPAAFAAQPFSEGFRAAAADFSMRLLREQAGGTENRLLSPVSLYLTLSMLAEGTQGQTREELDALLGAPEERGAMCAWLLDNWTVKKAGRVTLANSLWIDEGLEIRPAFLQANADRYRAAAYRADLQVPQALKDINAWVDYQTGGRIPRALDSLDPAIELCLLSTVLFDMKWEEPYEKKDVRSHVFQAADGAFSTEFLFSAETAYLENEWVTGFKRPYQGGRFSFVGLLPREGIRLEDAARALAGETWLALLDGAAGSVQAGIPSFSYADEADFRPPLNRLGVRAAFAPAEDDFAPMGGPGLFLSDIRQKTCIELNAHGTKAAAFSFAAICKNAGPGEEYQVILDRPFLYAIVDNASNLPLFAGQLTRPVKNSA